MPFELPAARTAQKLRLCFIIPWYGPKHSYIENDLPLALRAQNVDVRVVTSEFQPEFYVADWNYRHRDAFGPRRFPAGPSSHNGTEVVRLRSHTLGRWVILRKLTHAVEDFQPDLIEASGISAPLTWQASWVAKRLKIPLVVSHHMPQGPLSTTGLLERAQAFVGRQVLARAAGVYFVSQEARSHAIERYGPMRTRFWQMPLGVDTAIFCPGDRIGWENNRRSMRHRLGLNADTPLVVYTGRLEETKGMSLFVAAIKRLRDTGIHFAVAGRGACEDLIRSCPNTHLLDYLSLPDLVSLYRACDLAVWPDSMSVSQLHVLACGSLLLVPSPNPKPELIECGAMTFPRGDHVELASSVHRLAVRQGVLWENAVALAHVAATRFSWAAIAARRGDCYRQLLADVR